MSVGLEPFRRRLDVIDEQIARLLGERFEVCREVAHYKSEHEIPMMQPERVAQVRARYLKRGVEAELPPDFTADLFDLLINATCRMEDELMGTPEEQRVAVPVVEPELERPRLGSRLGGSRLTGPRPTGPRLDGSRLDGSRMRRS